MLPFKRKAWLVNSVFKNNQAFSSQGTEDSDKQRRRHLLEITTVIKSAIKPKLQ